MKRSWLALATLVALAVPATSALAQEAPPPGPAAQGPGGFGQRRMQGLLAGITLSAEQQSRIDSIRTGYQSQMPAFTPGVRPDSAAMAQRRELTQRMDADVRAVLSPEQQQVWDRNAEQLRQNMPRRPGG